MQVSLNTIILIDVCVLFLMDLYVITRVIVKKRPFVYSYLVAGIFSILTFLPLCLMTSVVSNHMKLIGILLFIILLIVIERSFFSKQGCFIIGVTDLAIREAVLNSLGKKQMDFKEHLDHIEILSVNSEPHQLIYFPKMGQVSFKNIKDKVFVKEIIKEINNYFNHKKVTIIIRTLLSHISSMFFVAFMIYLILLKP